MEKLVSDEKMKPTTRRDDNSSPHQFKLVFSVTNLMFSMSCSPVSVLDADSATADMNNPPLGAPQVVVRGTNADDVDAAASKSADRTETFLKNSILKIR
jgi:hypothetical protein